MLQIKILRRVSSYKHHHMWAFKIFQVSDLVTLIIKKNPNFPNVISRSKCLRTGDKGQRERV